MNFSSNMTYSSKQTTFFKKDEGVNPGSLSNREKAQLIDAMKDSGMRMLSWAGLGFFVLVGFSFLLYGVTAAVG